MKGRSLRKGARELGILSVLAHGLCRRSTRVAGLYIVFGWFKGIGMTVKGVLPVIVPSCLEWKTFLIQMLKPKSPLVQYDGKEKRLPSEVVVNKLVMGASRACRGRRSEKIVPSA